MQTMDNKRSFLGLFRGKVSSLNHIKVESPAGQPKTPNANLQAKPLATSSANASPWERLPTEVRQQIFDNLDEELIIVCITQTLPNPAPKPRTYFRWSDSMPPLVVALRSLPVSYRHAVQHFARINGELDLGFGCNISRMTKSELGVITSVRFDVGTQVCAPHQLVRAQKKRKGGQMSTMSFYSLTKPYRFRRSFSLAENLRTFHLSLDYRHFHRYNAAHFLTEFPFWLEGCKALSKVIVELPICRGVLRTEERNKIIFGMMELLYEKVGVEGRFVRATEYGMAEAEEWEWEAPAGTYMDWNKGLGKKWNPTRFREACRLMLLRVACRAAEADWE